MVMEAAAYHDGDGAESEAEWVQVRIASLRSAGANWRMGLFGERSGSRLDRVSITLPHTHFPQRSALWPTRGAPSAFII